MRTYKTSTPEFKESVELIETTDTNHADNVTAADIQNFQNTLANRELLRVLINFVYDSDSECIISALPADFDSGKLKIRNDMASVSGETLSLTFA